MINKNFPNRSKGKKIIFNKTKNIVPDLIPIHSKVTVKNSYRKTEKPLVDDIPDLIVSETIQKPNNICQNGFCLNLNIHDKEIGIGYCSTKCVIEHSKVLFSQFVQNRNSNTSNTPQETKKITNVSNTKSELESKINSCGSQLLKPDRKSSFTEKKIESNIDYIEILDDDEPRESLFNVIYNKVFSSKPDQDKNTPDKNSHHKTIANTVEESKTRVNKSPLPSNSNKRQVLDSPDVIFIGETKKQKIGKRKSDTVPEVIVID